MAQDTNVANQQAAREWQSNPALHKEFTSFDAYSAYCRAVASGRARVSEPKVLYGTENPTTTAPARALSSAQHLPDHAPQGGGFSAPDAAIGVIRGWSHPVSMDVLNIARDLRSTHRPMGRKQTEEPIAAKANVSMEVAGCAFAMAVQQYEKQTNRGG